MVSLVFNMLEGRGAGGFIVTVDETGGSYAATSISFCSLVAYWAVSLRTLFLAPWHPSGAEFLCAL